MKVKNSTSKKINTLTILTIIGVLLMSFFVLTNTKGTKKESSDVLLKNDNDINIPTKVTALGYDSLLTSTDQTIYNDDELSIYLIKSTNAPKLIYAYKKEPVDRQLTDNFFVHIYVKDSTKLRGNIKFANADFIQKPTLFQIQEQNYYVFQRDLISGNYTENYIPIDNVKYINTGRYTSGIGRSLDIRKLTPSNLSHNQLNNDLDKITITVTEKDFKKIKNKRKDALGKGVLISKDDDLINGQISLNNHKDQKTELRLKGDWTDHLKHDNKWSYRFIMKGENTFKGMRKFSIQHPIVRNYLWEWLFNKTVKDHGITGLRYTYVDVTLNVINTTQTKIPMGIMALEESFDKILIENNKKREGILLAFDESLLWKDREKQRILGLENQAQSKELHTPGNAQIKVFNQNKVLSDSKLLQQFNTAKDLLDGLRDGHYKISEVFDVELLSTYVALTNLFGGSHGIIWHNLRIYYNPITNKLEPVSFDSNSGKYIDKLYQYPMSVDDTLFQEKLREKLTLVSSTEFVKNLITNHADELESLKTSLFSEFNNEIDLDILVHNSNFIKKKLNPAVLITTDLLSYDDEKIRLKINNVSGQPVTIQHLTDQEGRVLDLNTSSITIKEKTNRIIDFKLSDYFINAFVSKKNKKGVFQYPKDVQKLRVMHHISGVDIERTALIKPYGKNQSLEKSVALYKKSKISNYKDFDFITQPSKTELLFKTGSYTLSKNLVIPKGFSITIEPGFSLDLKNNASIVSHASISSKGTKEMPIKFHSSDSTGGGIFITNAIEKSIVDYTYFENLSNPNSTIWSVSGAVNFHESEVAITNAVFANNRCEDALNIIRSQFILTDTLFENTKSDSFDGDFVTGDIERCTFINSGNDGIDVSGSELNLKDIVITNPSDKAISAGENSTITGETIKISGGEIGVVSKDLSKVNLKKLSIIDTRLGLSAFQKKTEYGVAQIQVSNLTLQNIELEYLIENKSKLLIDNIAVQTVSNNVIDQMYGKEYGKSSR